MVASRKPKRRRRSAAEKQHHADRSIEPELGPHRAWIRFHLPRTSARCGRAFAHALGKPWGENSRHIPQPDITRASFRTVYRRDYPSGREPGQALAGARMRSDPPRKVIQARRGRRSCRVSSSWSNDGCESARAAGTRTMRSCPRRRNCAAPSAPPKTCHLLIAGSRCRVETPKSRVFAADGSANISFIRRTISQEHNSIKHRLYFAFPNIMLTGLTATGLFAIEFTA